MVNKKWLLDCYEAKKRLPLRTFLVGDAIAPLDDVDNEDEEILCSQSMVLPDSKDSMKGSITLKVFQFETHACQSVFNSMKYSQMHRHRFKIDELNNFEVLQPRNHPNRVHHHQ